MKDLMVNVPVNVCINIPQDIAEITDDNERIQAIESEVYNQITGMIPRQFWNHFQIDMENIVELN